MNTFVVYAHLLLQLSPESIGGQYVSRSSPDAVTVAVRGLDMLVSATVSLSVFWHTVVFPSERCR